ncbi:uncharacterized protein LOC118737512 [Rhagoletis pomonella]|uniref:uncharacterized protein LOC118737512 n=1 Tax=Rhagoletis pomonella TaxID=28610 RepID=UPI00177C7621|nr:uncharacterized protein LOC118737512 [Rhagoletis pomonella]
MINKLEFNNLVITNKKKIQKIKTQTIQKLVQKIKKLKYILEKKPEYEKNKERFRKATLCLEELKKLKCIDLMKRVLVLEKSPSAILTNGLCSPEEMAVAMVAVNKLMHDLVNVLKENLGLTDENNAWKKELMQASKRRVKILRTEQKRKNRQNLKAQKIIACKRLEWLKNQNGEQSEVNGDENNVSTGLQHDEGANISTLGYWKIEPINDESSKKSEKGKTNYKETRAEEKAVKKRDKPEANNRNILKTNTKTSDQLKSINTRKPDLERNVIEPTKNMLISFDSNLEDEKFPESLKEEITHVVDPFFITASGENYRSTAVVVRNGQVLDSQTNKANDNARKRPVENYTTRENRSNVRIHNKDVQDKSRQSTGKKNNSEGLHPSWVAKQKLKPVIGSFQGKKIKFDDVDNSDLEERRDEEVGPKNNFALNKSTKSTENDKDLHPSWAAKQKFKPVITDFKGKKIVFGDEVHEEIKTQEPYKVAAPAKNAKRLNTTDTLHPSWIAKQKLKPAIATFQGKKITFNDDD